MSDWAFAQGDPIVNPFWHDLDFHCDSDCGYMDCRWLNCGCEGHAFWKGKELDGAI